MNNLSPVYTLKNECNDCYRCVRECHVKAIKIKDGAASILSDKCIACGACVKACPSGAKRVRNDLDKVKALLTARKKVFVSLAPSWAGIFDCAAGKMVGLLKKLGFAGVSETALGAQEVSIRITRMLHENGLYISSACPVVVDYIRMYKPEFTENIVSIASPALTHAQMLKNVYGDDMHVVFIGPCIGKKNEAEKRPDLIYAALTFEELNYWIKDELVSISDIEPGERDKFVPGEAHEGALYPLEGGMNETIRQCGMGMEGQLVSTSSLPALDRALDGLHKEKIDKMVFLEALSCAGGCVNGPCAGTRKSGLAVLSDILSEVKKRDKIPSSPAVVVEENYQPQPVESQTYSLEEIFKAMKKIGKHSEEDELNCGGCGYATCRDLAAALLSGDAENSMCVSYMRKLAMQKAAAMLRRMPSAIVMVDSGLKILEANDVFMRMFCGDMYEFFSARADGLNGVAIDRIVDFSYIFKQTLQTKRDIRKEHFPIKNRLYNLSVFTIEEDEIVGAIITDVTQSEVNREKIAQKAREVITKNVATVQEIACLLGEHMVETELLLNSIAQSYDPEAVAQTGSGVPGDVY